MARFSDVPTDPRYAPPARPWLMSMQWLDLLFMHWPVPAATLQKLIPTPLELDTFDSQAWLGVVPFRMTGVGPRFLNRLPWVSHFAELNVRTYVVHNGRPGVWFFSLDAANPLAVWTARRTFHLPYFNAKMSAEHVGEEVRYSSTRTHRGAAPAEFAAGYRPIGPATIPPEGSLDRWLTWRYSLYSADARGRVYRGDIMHDAWPLQPAEAQVARNTMTAQIDFALPDMPPLLHFARRLDVVAWRLKCVAPG
jgi:uncharacterized protein